MLEAYCCPPGIQLYALASEAFSAPSSTHRQTLYGLLSGGVFDMECLPRVVYYSLVVERTEVGEGAEAFGELAEVRCAACLCLFHHVRTRVFVVTSLRNELSRTRVKDAFAVFAAEARVRSST